MEALENKNRSYDSIFKGIDKQQNNKRRRENRAAESQMKERGSELKTMSNEFMDSVGYPLANDPPQFLVHPPGLAVPEERVKV